MAAIGLVWVTGCSHVISKDILKDIDTKTRFADISRSPESYRGKTVLLGGVIVKTTVKKDGTLLEVYETRLDRTGEPKNPDVSQGRFLGHYNGFLDTEIYRKGRKVTIAGKVEGEQSQKIGEIDYRYPFIIIREIHLWEVEKPLSHEPYPSMLRWDPWWDPWWWHPWYLYP